MGRHRLTYARLSIALPLCLRGGSIGGSAFLSGDTPAECEFETDCPDGEYCVVGTCVIGAPQDAFIDVELDAAPQWVDAAQEIANDAGIADVDVPDVSVGDMRVIETERAPFPEGLCFAGQNGLVFRPEQASNFIPSGHCSRWARGWMVEDGPESILQLATGPNAQVLSIPVSEEPTVSGHWLIAPRDNALESATNILASGPSTIRDTQRV